MDDTSKILWHPAFYIALKLELSDYINVLTFESEHQLNTEPLRIDVLIIKKPANVVIEKNIGRIFRAHNIVEYKSPDDYLALDDFHRGLAYGYLYCALENITLADLTITFSVSRRPQKVWDYLCERGGKIVEHGNGIYEITGWIVPLQIVIAPELSNEDNLLLKQLRTGLDVQSVDQVVTQLRRQRSIKYGAYLEAIARANMAVLLEGRQKMSAQTFEELFVSSGIADKVEARGEARGKAIGEARGEARGKAEREAELILGMLSRGHSPQAVADFTGIPLSQIEKVIAN